MTTLVDVGSHFPGARLPIEQVASRWIIATTPSEVVDAVRPYVDAGFDHLVLHGPGHDQERFLTDLEAQNGTTTGSVN